MGAAASARGDAAPPLTSSGPPATPPPPTVGGSGPSGAGPRDGSRKRPLLPILAGLALIVAVVIVVIVVSSGGSSAPKGEPFAAAAQPVPTNQVTGSGTATIHLNGNVLSATVDTNGLLNGQPHAMHIHAGAKGICPPASAAQLHNGHRAISTTNGIHFYGPPQVALTTRGDTSVKSIVDLQRYPSVGDIRYTRGDIVIPPGVAAAIRAGDAVVVVHGIDYDHNGIYDNILDRSELTSSLPGEATAPALCGSLKPTKTASTAGGSAVASTTYTVTLHRFVASAAGPGEEFALLCHLIGVDATAAIDPRASAGTAT
jgi:hypothetical protein